MYKGSNIVIMFVMLHKVTVGHYFRGSCLNTRLVLLLFVSKLFLNWDTSGYHSFCDSNDQENYWVPIITQKKAYLHGIIHDLIN